MLTRHCQNICYTQNRQTTCRLSIANARLACLSEHGLPAMTTFESTNMHPSDLMTANATERRGAAESCNVAIMTYCVILATTSMLQSHHNHEFKHKQCHLCTIIYALPGRHEYKQLSRYAFQQVVPTSRYTRISVVELISHSNIASTPNFHPPIKSSP